MSTFTKSRPLVAAVAAIGLVAISAPAFAGTAGENTRRYNAKTVQTGGDPLYCVSEPMPGSFIPKRVCLTKRGWTKAGAQVIEKDVPVLAANNDKSVRQN